VALTMALHSPEPKERAKWSKLTQRLVRQRCERPASHIGVPFVDTHPLAIRFGLADGPWSESGVNRATDRPPFMRVSVNVSKSVIAEGFSTQGQLHRHCGHLTDLGHRALIARRPSGNAEPAGPAPPGWDPKSGRGVCTNPELWGSAPMRLRASRKHFRAGRRRLSKSMWSATELWAGWSLLRRQWIEAQCAGKRTPWMIHASGKSQMLLRNRMDKRPLRDRALASGNVGAVQADRAA
jgi:hypothetical protein